MLRRYVRSAPQADAARGTVYGTCILHVAPEAHAGGTLALVRDGDLIELDVPNRRLELRVGEQELGRRRAAWKVPRPHYKGSYGALYARHVTQANEGCDFDFLAEGRAPEEPAIH